jgi:hypothetical protein
MTETLATHVAKEGADALESSNASTRPVLHIICDRDAGLFNLVQGVIPHTYYALKEGRIPIVYYGEKNCYWTPKGYRGRDTVWEYYFEPVIPDYPVSRIPLHVLNSIADNPPKNTEPGYFVDDCAFVSNHGFWGIKVDGEALRGPGTHESPSRKIRALTSTIIRNHIRPRPYILENVERFFREFMSNRYVIGVHIRGTDALGDPDRHVKVTQVNFDGYTSVLRRLRRKHPDALIFVASDAQESVDRIREAFSGVIAYDSIRHHGGELTGSGPAGGRMPAYLTQDRERAAQNGEEAVIEYLLLCRCNYLVHNRSSIPRTVLLSVPEMEDTNIDVPSPLWRRARTLLQKAAPLRRR